jgi:RecA-family ATPase
MASGKSLLGLPVKQLRVWYINLEDPLEEIERRLTAVCLRYGITSEDLGGRLFIDSGRDRNFVVVTADRGGVKPVEGIVKDILAGLRENQIDVAIFDPFVSIHNVNENDNAAIDAAAKQCARIADAGNCGVEIVHHTRKTNGSEITAEDSGAPRR